MLSVVSCHFRWAIMDSSDDLSQKLEAILNSFICTDFCKRSNAEFELLITRLSKSEHTALQTPVVLDWIDKCVNIVLEDFKRIHHSVISFMLKLCAHLTKNEWLVIGLRERNTIEKIETIVKGNFCVLTPSIKIGHIRLLAAISDYGVGLRWIKNNKSWRYLIKYCSGDHTLYVVREASSLICNILYKLSTKTCDNETCLLILNDILKPIDQNVYEDTLMIVNVDDAETQKHLRYSLDLISMIFEKIVEGNEKSPIPYLCEVHHKLEVNLWKLSEMTHNEFFLEKILKALTSYNFAMLLYEKWKSNIIDPLDFNRFGVNFFYLMKYCIARRCCNNFLKLTTTNHYLWKKLGSRAPSEIFIENENIQFENQLIMFHLIPVLCIVNTQNNDEEIFNQYIMKLFSISSEFTIRICYSIRDILLDCPELAAQLAYKSIYGILSMKTILSKDQAVLVFQALVYVLKEFASENSSNDGMQMDLIVRIPQVLYATLVCLHTLVKEYTISWKDSIETMCLMDLVLLILNNPNLSTLMVVQAIKLTQLSVEHFLSPNMALLIDNMRGSGLHNLGPIIIKNLHNTEWEVRDSILELVTSVVSISQLKFPAFRQYILENDICSLVCSIVKNDSESYVRASGLKCLTIMVSVNVLWEQNLTQSNLVEYLLWVIYNESEGIIRKEAINCIIQMYVHRRINVSNYSNLYRALVHSAVHDLYWEVKVAALNFWEIEIFQQFTNQGMIDGTFPTVTFSKEKKIVNLTESEIILRIERILKELSLIGCLDVLLKCLNDESDFEPVKVAMRVIKTLFEKLDKYDYEKALVYDVSNGSKKEYLSNEKCIDQSVSTENESQSLNYEEMKADVINDIVSSSDIQLIIKSYKHPINVSNNNIFKNESSQSNSFITPRDFINRIKDIDIDKQLGLRNNWLNCSENLASLLDDMILSVNPKTTHYADCY